MDSTSRMHYAENKKLYVQHVKLPLLISVNKEGKEKWQSDAKPVLSKLETIASFKVVANVDGCAVAKQIDKWLAKYALRFKALNITSLRK
eukprot:4688435-Pleurochrysis_carterae.AAC.1